MKKQKQLLTFIFLLFSGSLNGRHFIAINPHGDNKKPGHKLYASTEQKETYALATALTECLKNDFGHTALLTRSTNEIIENVDRASFVNRLAPDFYLSIHLYETVKPKPQITILQCICNPITDFSMHRNKRVKFIPYHQAHQHHCLRSQKACKLLKSYLSNDYFQNTLTVKNYLRGPIKSLTGITSAGLALEIGLNSKTAWRKIVDALAESLHKMLTDMEQTS